MKTIPPAHAQQQLTYVADRFDEWRQTRTTRAEPIPQHLWEQAIALTHHAAQPAPASTALRFVEVMATPVPPTPPVGTEIELHRPDGTRLRIYTNEPQPPLVALVRTFLETPGCSR
jgi:hypothetical protein